MDRQGDPDEATRAAGRARLPVRVFRLGEEPGDDLRESTTPEERLAMMWPLAVEAWRLAGRTMPDYPRAGAPVIVRRGAGSE